MNLRIDPAAEEETREAAQWYEDRRGGLGLEFLAEVDAGVQQIRTDPFLRTCPPTPSPFCWREQSFGDQVLAQLHSIGVIHGEHRDRDTANGRTGDDQGTFEAEMPAPFVSARVEEGDQFRPGTAAVSTHEIRAFMKVAMQACPSKVPQVRGARVLFGDDVLEGEPPGMKIFRQTDSIRSDNRLVGEPGPATL